MKISSFIASAFGVIGFVVSMVAGLLADNSTEAILLRAILFAAVCYVVGYGVGMVAQQVSTEHAQRLARKVADQDAADETQRLEEAAELEAQAATRIPVETAASPAPAAAVKS